jgi:hypothetical protein
MRASAWRSILAAILAALLLAMMFLLAGGAALRESVTFDEVAHIGAGVSYLQKLDLRYNEEHPPLAKVLAALPLVIRGVHADYSHAPWTVSTTFFTAFLGQWVFGEYLITRWNDPQSTLVWARFPMLLLTVALGWIVFLCARRLGGDWGGLLCVAVYASMPAFLVFGPLVLTDIPITFFSSLTLWAMAGLWDNPDRKNTLLVGAALGGAILTKFTAPILFLAFIGVSLSLRWRPLAEQMAERPWRKLRWRAMRLATLWAGIIVYVVYFVLSWNQPMDIPGLAEHGFVAGFVGRLLMPPWMLLRGVAMVVLSGNRPTFILGHPYPHGVWFYFPVLLVVKSSLGFLGLLLMVLAIALVARRWNWLRVIPTEYTMHWRVLWVSLAVFWAMCVLSHFNVSVRHLTIPLALMILLLAPLPRLLARLMKIAPAAGWTSTAAVILLAASCLVTAVRAYPYYLPYMNPLFSGHPAYWLATDSNLDWDQSLPEVQQFVQRHGLNSVPMDMYGMFESTAWVPVSKRWDCQAPTAADAGQWVVVSANMILDEHNCGWLMQYPHESMGGGSVYAVQLPAPIPPAGSPGGPPAVEARRIFLGMPFDMRDFFQRIARQPEDIPKAMAELQAVYQKQMQAPKK